MNKLKQIDWRLFTRRYATALFGVLLFVIFSFASENFCTWSNLMIMLRSMSMLCICALGFTFVMAAGGFDMSLGNASGLVNMVFVYTLIASRNLLLGLLAALAVGLAVGLVNGMLSGFIGLPDFIATYAVGSVAYGIKMLISRGNPTTIPKDIGLPQLTFTIGQGRIKFIGGLTIPVPVIIMVVFCVVVVFILKKTPLGRRIYAIGGNRVASQYGGINVKKYRMITFLFSGVFLAVASVIQTSRLGSGQPLAGEDFMMDTIAAVYLSTTMFGEGEPTPEGTIVGVFIITMLTNGMTMLGLEYYFQYITKGVVVILAVLMSIVQASKARK
nr:ABC transporter permease [uncultured Oscillibacter sp.]